MERIKIKEITHKIEDKNLSFRVLDLNDDFFNDYKNPHQNDHFSIFIVESGNLDLHIEEQVVSLKSGKISIVFPEQISNVVSFSSELEGKVILFEEVLFCSDILKNELLSYNVDLSSHLNSIFVSPKEFEHVINMSAYIEDIYKHPSLVRKEQARFYIKILLLGLIESVHGQHPIIQQETDKLVYIRFKKLLNERYKTERTVQFYASELAITTKKLNNITKKHSGETAINTIHHRILQEIKRLLLFSELSHKQISLELGFSSPSALNKFVKTKLDETPTELQKELAQIYNK